MTEHMLFQGTSALDQLTINRRAGELGGEHDADTGYDDMMMHFEVFNDDAPAVVLFAMDNVAAVHARVADVRIRPDSHWALVRTWRIPADRMIERDRVAAAAR